MVNFYKSEVLEYNNISYGEKISQLRSLEERLEADIKIYAKKYEDAHDIDISNPYLPKNKWIEWKDARRRILIILCNYIIDKCHVLIKSGDIAIPFSCRKESDLYAWFRKNRRHLGIVSAEYHQGGTDYRCQYEHNHRLNCTINQFAGGKRMSIEMEYLSSNFIRHRHDVDYTDMIICYEKDMDIFYDNPKGEKVPILELNYKSEKQIMLLDIVQESHK